MVKNDGVAVYYANLLGCKRNKTLCPVVDYFSITACLLGLCCSLHRVLLRLQRRLGHTFASAPAL